MLVQLSILVLCHTALAVPIQPEYDVKNSDLIKNLFENFIVKYKRSYDAGEKIQRFQYFKQSLAEINRLNEANPMAVFDINKFCDWSPEELKTLAGLKTEHLLSGTSLCGIAPNVTTHDAPASFDWKDKGAVTSVKNQRRCGSCWAFSATGVVESAYAIKHNKLMSLSEQQLMDCDKQSDGCWGGVVEYGLTKLIQEGGQELESDYPYIAQQSHACYFDNTKVAVKVSSCNVYTITEDQLKEVLFKNGPLSIGIDSDPLDKYDRGIISNCSLNKLDHAVLLVGYGTEDGTDFWHVKNSWGADWGEQGYFRMNRGDNCMGLGQSIVSATVE